MTVDGLAATGAMPPKDSTKATSILPDTHDEAQPAVAASIADPSDPGHLSSLPQSSSCDSESAQVETLSTGSPGSVASPRHPSASTHGNSSLLPSPPLTSDDACRRSVHDAVSPPTTPLRISHTTFTTPVRVSETTEHPWNTPAPSATVSVAPSVSPAIQLRPSGGTHSDGGPVHPTNGTLETPKPRHIASPRPGRSPRPSAFPSFDPETYQSSPLGWQRQSFARGGGSSDEENERPTSILPSLILVPLDTDQEFLSGVQRIVDREYDSSSEDRTPSPLPRTSGSPDRLHASMRNYSFPSSSGYRAAGGELDRLRSEQQDRERRQRHQAESFRPEYLRRSRDGASVSPRHSPVRGEASSSRMARSISRLRHEASKSRKHTRSGSDGILPRRTTRAKDAKELEAAIAAVDEFETRARTQSDGQTQGKGKGKALDSDFVVAPSSSTIPRRSTPPNKTFLPSDHVGVTVSPIKGRRIKLLRPATPPEKPPTPPGPSSELISPVLLKWLDSSKTQDEKKLPKKEDRPMDWTNVDISALGIDVKSTVLDAAVDAEVQDERQTRKRKRLEAFKDDSSDSSADGDTTSGRGDSSVSSRRRTGRAGSASPLKPALVDGLGRMAIHPGELRGARIVPPSEVGSQPVHHKTLFGRDVLEDDSLMSDVATGGAGLRDLWSNRSNQGPPQPSMPDVAFAESNSPTDGGMIGDVGPNWPESRFPWSLNNVERKRRKSEGKQERLALVESFLTRESESDSDSESGMASTEPIGEAMDEDTVVVGARGLWALTQEPSPRSTTASLHVSRLSDQLYSVRPGDGESSVLAAAPAPMAPNDPADARIVFASRRDVRSVLYRVTQRREDQENSGEVNCICGGADDGRPMVQCDSCKTWSHQACANIRDESELDEKWYCPNCLAEESTMHQEPLSAPTLVQAEEPSPDSTTNQTPVFLGAPQLEDAVKLPPSPQPSGSWIFPAPPKTPKAHDSTKSSRGAPATPRTWLMSRIQRTPRFFEDAQETTHSPGLDPTSTPSRGTKYGLNFFPSSTPRASRLHFGDGAPSTPTRSAIRSNPFSSATPGGHQDRSNVSSGSTLKDTSGFASPQQHYSTSFLYTNTPIQHSRPPFHGLAPAFSVGSPVAHRRKETKK